MNRNNNSRFSAPQIPEDLMKQIASTTNYVPQQTGYQVPTEIVELPSRGAFYPEGHPLHNIETVEIKSMTTKEEDIITSPTLVENGLVFDRVLESILVDKRIVPSTLLVGDRSAILAKARISAYGPEYSFVDSCNSCGSSQVVEFMFDKVKPKELLFKDAEVEDGLLKMTLPKSGAVVHLKLLDGKDEKEIQEEQKRRRKIGMPEEQLITTYKKIILKVNGSDDFFHIANFISNMPVLDSRYMRKIYSECKPELDLTYQFECKKCGHVDEGGVVSITGDFFWPQL